MSLFNSLGSNYTSRIAIRSLFSSGRLEPNIKLVDLMEQRYGGPAHLTYKGREALAMALAAANLAPGSAVAITGFTCYAVYRAVVSTKLDVHYLDIDPGTLNFSPRTLTGAITANPQIKAVIVQNTLGYPCDIAAIEQICQAHKLILIEDLAHSVGATYPDGREVGTVGDFTMLSFGRDKIIDAVSGGALITRRPRYRNFQPRPLLPVPAGPKLRDRLYPALTAAIRATYAAGLGKPLHLIFKKIGLLSRSVDGEFYGGHKLPYWYTDLAFERYQTLDSLLAHRRRTASLYARHLDPSIQFGSLQDHIPNATNLRFPIRVKNRAGLIQHLAGRRIYLSDTWYDAPVAPPRYLHLTSYNHHCPQAEVVAAHILNLPTHLAVSEHDAIKLSEHINQWLQSH